MVDVIIEPAATAASQFMRQSMQGREIVDVGSNRYDFYIYNDGLTLDYKKSLDKGATWGAAINVYSHATDPIKKLSVHFDQWTKDNFGSIICIALLAGGAGGPHTDYYTLATATDVLTGPVDFLPSSAGSVSATVGWVGAGRTALTLFAGRTGRLHALGWIDNGPTDGFHSISDDGGLTWNDTTHESLQDATPSEGSNAIKIIGVAGNDGDSDDIWVFMMDQTPRMKVRVYDFSALSWNAASVIQNITTNNDVNFDWGVQQYFATESYFVVFWSDDNAAGSDLHCYEVIDSTTFIQRTDALTNFGFSFGCVLFIDQATGDLYVGHFNGSPTVTVSVYQIISDDGGLTWVRTQFDENAADDHRWLGSPPSGSTTGARWQLIWRNDDLDDILTNFNNKIEVAGVPTEPPPGPPEIVPPGGTYDPAPGAPPGSIVYITPDLIEYPLVTPHRTGRFVMSFSGFGMAPIQYTSQRGPNQDGETVRDFNLTPRVVQLLERQQFKGREAWWDGRADILNDLRPNRQATATGVVTGTLRMVTSDGSLRDLNVFIQEGPRFEARNVDKWDEWAFEEVLRFIAHDPLFFDPTRVDFALAFTLDANLVFPITFPIQFGGGAIDTTFNLDYTGTWASLPTIVIVGPLDNPIIDNVITGETIALQRNIGPGRTVTIDLAFGQKTITDDLGTNLLGSLTTDSDLGTWHIAPTPEAPQVVGQPRPTARNVIRLRGSNPTGSTSVQVRYFTRFVGI